MAELSKSLIMIWEIAARKTKISAANEISIIACSFSSIFENLL